jgi:hypothetical protein
MYGQKPQGMSHESFYGHFYVSLNEWVADYGAGVRGVNLRGCHCMLDLNVTDEDKKCRAIHVGPGTHYAGSTTHPQYAVGILADDMIMGQHPLTGVWVRVLMAGYTDRVQMSAAADDNDELLYIGTNTTSGNHETLRASAFATAQNFKLRGGAVLDTTLSSNTYNLDGTAGTGVTPISGYGVDRDSSVQTWDTNGVGATGGSMIFGGRVVGWRIPGQGDLRISPEEEHGLIYTIPGSPPPLIGHKVSPGYVNFMQPFRGWI